MAFSTLGACAASLGDRLGIATLGAGGVTRRRMVIGGGGGSTLGDGGCGAMRCRRGGGIGGFSGDAKTGRGDATIKPFFVTVVASRGERRGCVVAGSDVGGWMGSSLLVDGEMDLPVAA